MSQWRDKSVAIKKIAERNFQMIGEMHSYLPIFFQDLVGKKKKKSPKLILGRRI